MAAEQPTSVTLLQRVRLRDPEAWRRLLHLYVPLVDYWSRQWGVQGADADDIQQEVFQAVAAGLDKFDRERDGGTFRGWLRGITRHKLLDHYRRREQRPEAQGGTDAYRRLQQVSQPSDELEEPAEQVQGLFQRALELVRSEFEPNTWTAFWRVTVEGHAPDAVAAEMGVTPAAIRKAKSRVLRRLKEEVGDVLE